MHQRHTQVAQDIVSDLRLEELLYYLPTMDNSVVFVEVIVTHVATNLQLATDSQPALRLLRLFNRLHNILEIAAEVHWMLIKGADGYLNKLSVF
jgi:hypothetical protein